MFCRNSHAIIAAFASCFLAIILAGCSGGIAPLPTGNAADITGNWQVSSSAPAAARLAKLSGALSGTGALVTGIFHSTSASACVAPSAPIKLTGSASADDLVTLSGALAGGTLSISGTLATDGKSLTGASYNVTGGSCAFTAKAAATAQAYSPVTGNYVGSFIDTAGQLVDVDASLTQTPASDADGNFLLSGTATLPNNPCFASPVSVSNSQVTGGSFTLTYSDTHSMNSVTATGSFSNDANTINVTSWTLSGTCGPDTGTGSFTRQ